MTNYDVTFQRKDHEDAVVDWVLVDDVCAGERRIKDKNDTYLPRLNPIDKSEKNKKRYEGFLNRAVFYNVTGRTLEGLIGAVFRKSPNIQTPTELEYVKDDANGRGVNIIQQSKKVLGEVLKKGRHALFVDYPKTDRTLTKKEVEDLHIKATIVSIKPENIRNWRIERIGGMFKYTLVVIEEQKATVTEDGFGEEYEQQFRVLRLIDNVYQVEVYGKNQAGEWVVVEPAYQPKDGAGSTWDIIPFSFVGAENNDPSIDKAPLLDLATLNIAHYRDSALYQDSAYYVGQPQPYMTGLSEDWRDWLEEKGIVVGSVSVLPLPENGSFGFAQVEPNTLVKEAMDKKEDQMKGLGARILQKGQAVKTATEAQGDNESEHSVLSLAASNVSDAFRQVLTWVARYNNTNDSGIEFELNQDFIEQSLDAQMLTALVAAWQSGRLPSSSFWDRLRAAGLIDPEKTDEEIEEELDGDISNLNLDDDEDDPDII